MLWCTVHAPAGGTVGVHTGTITLPGPRVAAVAVAVEATVFGFALPTTPAIRTAFDLSEAFIGQVYTRGNRSTATDAALYALFTATGCNQTDAWLKEHGYAPFTFPPLF